MTYKSSYIKEVERYFLSLAGKGIMLSSMDYDIIVKWKKREIPKEVIYKGISKAFENHREKKDSTEFPRGLTHCVSFVEEEIKSYRSAAGVKFAKLEPSKNDIIEKTAERLARIIASEKREKIQRCYTKTRKRILDLINSKEEDAFKLVERIEEDFYEFFFQTLTQSERERIALEAENMISKRRRFMTEKARRESVLSFRNEILKRDYELKDILSDD